MVIQCEQCRTKFKLDDEKVSERGVKVRCAKCRHVFTVRKEVAAAVPPPEEPLAAPSQATENSFDLGQTDAAPAPAPDFAAFSAPAAAAVTPQSFDLSDKTVVMPPREAPSASAPFIPDFDFGAVSASADGSTVQGAAFDFSDQPKSSVPAAAETDLAGFDFGDTVSPVAAPADIEQLDFSTFAAAAPAPAQPAKSASGLDFSFDDAAIPAAAAPADSFDLSGIDFGKDDQPARTAAPQVESFSLGDLDLSADAAPVTVDTATPLPAGTLFAPVEAAVAGQQTVVTPDISFEAAPAAEDAPPLAISSRRRQSSSASILIAVVTVAVVAVLGFVAYTFISDGPKALSVFGKPGVPAEDGRIVVRNVKAFFIPKAAGGELLVITGEALNSFKKPRAALQVKAVVLNSDGQAVATRTAYAGNTLTPEQLKGMTAEKIEAAMNNQFGDSLVNMEVQPGAAVPFTIVIINPPADGKEFSVEPLGSTVAAAK